MTVNSVQPGLHATPRVGGLYGGDVGRAVGDIPAGEMGDPADFGAVVAFLCSQRARHITGVGLPVDGGEDRALV